MCRDQVQVHLEEIDPNLLEKQFNIFALLDGRIGSSWRASGVFSLWHAGKQHTLTIKIDIPWPYSEYFCHRLLSRICGVTLVAIWDSFLAGSYITMFKYHFNHNVNLDLPSFIKSGPATPSLLTVLCAFPFGVKNSSQPQNMPQKINNE